MSKRIVSTLAFLLLLPAIATVAAPPPPNIHFSVPSLSPSAPGPNDQVTVNVTVTANAGIQNVTLHFTTDNWKATNTTVVASYNSTTHFALVHIPPQYNGGHVEYYLVAFDNNNNMGISNNGGNYFTYTVAAPTSSATTSMWIEIAIVLVAVGAAVSIGFYSLKPKTSHQTNSRTHPTRGLEPDRWKTIFHFFSPYSYRIVPQLVLRESKRIGCETSFSVSEETIVKPVADSAALLLERQGERVVVVADLHLGWEVSLSHQGIHVPSQVPRLLERLRKIINDVHPRQLILLGDVKHAVAKVEMEEWKYVPEFFEGLVEIIPDVQVVPGNHDGNLEPLTPPSVKISTSEGISLWNSVGLFHGHAWPSPPLLGCSHLVMGHLHPVVIFKDPLGFRITRQAWVRARSSGTKLAEGVLKHDSVKYEGDPLDEYAKKYGVKVVDADCVIMPSFNEYLGGQPINRAFTEGWTDLYKEYMGPVLRSGAVDFEDGEAYLFDGTFLGRVQDLRKLAQ